MTLHNTRILHAAVIIVVATGMAAVMGSCGLYNRFHTPDQTPLTREYAQALAAPLDSAAVGNLPWEDVFTDPLLADFIRQALYANVDLRNAQLSVQQAQAQLLGAKLAYLPSVALTPSGAGSKYGVTGSSWGWTYQLPATVSWEADIFGRLTNAKRSAQAAVLQSEAYQQAVRSQIVSAVATTYYTIAATKAQLQLSRSTAEVWAKTVETMKDLKAMGDRGVTEAAVVQAAANYYGIRANITDLEASLSKLATTMALLLAQTPGEVQYDIPAEATLAVPAAIRGGGVPLRQLAARPDVRAAEQTLAEAFYATAGARAAFYPSLNISFTGGFTNALGSMIRNPGVWFAQLAGQLTAPLFSRGANIANLKAAKARQEQALNNFQYSLMSAAGEVNDAVSVYQRAAEKAGYLDSQVQELVKSTDYTMELLMYDGRSTYLEVLTAQQSLLSAQMGVISCQLAQAQAIINLYQSLGGGR